MKKISDTAISFQRAQLAKKKLDKISFETAQLADLQSLSALLTLLFAQEHDFSPDTAAQQQGLTAILQQADSGRILVARHEGVVIAMVSLLYTISTALGGRVALLEDMVVQPDYRGQGVGARLLEYALAYARTQQILRITLLTDHDNAAAQQLYRQHGFQQSGMQAWRLIL
ncbi:MAG: GNAT family N-acetyltransferase [Methylophilus sp.]|uniref:GNAT family N-acetyltransferase n=2 Tax=Methylophilus sp. TaxID=29541 RepID=UPI004036DB3E